MYMYLEKKWAVMLSKRRWCITCVDMKKKICANRVVVATVYLLLTHTAVQNPQLLVGRCEL